MRCRIISRMAAVPEPSLILSFEEARHLVEDHAAHLRPHGKELVELLEVQRRLDKFWPSRFSPTAIFRHFPGPCATATQSGPPILPSFPQLSK